MPVITKLKRLIFGYSVVLLLLVNQNLRAQATTITVGGVAPTFTRLALAFNAISAGSYTGAVHVQIKGNTNETVKATLSQHPLVDSVMIYPIAAAVVQGNIADVLVELNGADFVHIDGRINRTGSVSSLTISNTNATTSAYTLSFKNAATKNSVRYTTFKGSGTAVMWFEASGAGLGNNYNLVEKSFIGDGATTPRYAIYSQGSFNGANHGNKILNNCIYNYFDALNRSAGIYLYEYCSNWDIIGNSFYQTAARSSSWENHAIKVLPSTFASFYKFKIQDNFIGGSTDSCGGPSFPISTFIGIEMRSHSDTLTHITNNKIRNMSVTGSFFGIRTDYGKTLIQYNSIGDSLGTGSLLLSANTQTAYGIVTTLNDSVKIFNNCIGAITSSCSITGIEVSNQSGTSKVTVTGNLIGSRTVSNSIQVISTGTSAIAGIRHNVTNGIVNKNTIMNLTGVFVSGGTGNCNITGIRNSSGYTWDNHISNLKSNTQGTSYAGCTGILTFEAKNNFVHHLDFYTDYYTVVGLQCYTAVNNIVALGFGITSASQFYGIYGDGGVNAGYFHNTVCLGGMSSSPYMSTCLFGGNMAKSNIFYCVRTSTIASPGTNYCSYASGSANANCYYVSGPGNVVAWSAGINYSTWGTGGAYVNPMLVNVGSQLAFSYKPTIVLNGTNVYGGFVPSVPTDYFVFTRPSPPTMGAIEKNTCVTVPHTKNVASCASSYSIGSQTYTLSGTYNQTLTYPGGCDTLLTLNLQLGPTAPTLAANPSTICAGQNATLSAAGAVNYTWSAAGSPTTANIVVNPVTTSIYTVAASNSVGCVGMYTLELIALPLPTLTLNSGQICAGDSFTFTPGGAVTYTYLNGGSVVTPASTTTYSISGTGANGCIAGTSAQVTVNSLPVITVNSGSLCTGSVYTLAPGGGVSYTYSPSGPTVSPTSNATFVVTGADANGCVQSASATINVLPLPTVAVSGGSVCSGTSFTLQPSGGVSYIYQNGGPVVAPTSTSIYSVNSVDANNCVSAASATAQILVVPLPSLTIVASSTFVCQGQSFSLTASGANTYLWNTGNPNPGFQTTMPVGIHQFTVTGTDTSTGCTNTSGISVMVDPCTGIKEQSGNVVFEFFPNPASAMITVKCNSEGTLVLRDLTGRLLLTKKITAGETLVDVSQQLPGVYMLSFSSSTMSRNYSFVKE